VRLWSGFMWFRKEKDFLNMGMCCFVSLNVGNFLIRLVNISFSVRSLLQQVSLFTLTL